MANSLLGRNNQSNGNLVSQFNRIKSMGPSGTLFNSMYNNNGEFRKFADSMRGKTPQQAFSEYGLDFSKFKNMRW